MSKEEKEQRKQAKLEKKDKIWLEKYVVSYSESISKIKKQKHKNFSKTKKILIYNKKSAGKIILLFVLGIISGVFSLGYAVSIQNIIDSLTLGNFGLVIGFAVTYALVDIISRTISWFFLVLSTKTTNEISHNLRKKLAKAVCLTKVSKYDTTATGEIINRIAESSHFTTNIRSILTLTSNILYNIAFIFYAVFINVWLGLFLLGIGLYGFIIKYIFLKKKFVVIRKRNNILNDRIVSQNNELVRGIKDARHLNVQDNFLDKVVKTSLFRAKSAVDLSQREQVVNSFQAYGRAILVFLFIALGIVFIQAGQVTAGAFIVLLVYRPSIIGIFDNLASMYMHLQDTEISSERMCEILEDEDYPKEKFGDVNLESVQGKIEFKDVTYAYKEDEPLFENLNFVVKPNECIGIVGKSGQGKSTIISLISKLYDLKNGQILLDDVDITQLNEQSLRDNISTVPQSPYIFNLSIKENLLLAKPDATQEDLEEVCKKAFIHDFIITKPQGYDTIVGEGGITLSGGQKQRLAIARVLLKNSKVILFDEATSSLDNESQEKIKKTIKAMKENKTIIIVAHRLTTVKDCDRIFVMDGNKIVASGKHRALMTGCEVYRNLYQNEEE